MGWTYTSKDGLSVQDFFAKEFKSDWADGRTGRVIRCSATWNVAYMAYEIKTPAKDTEPAKREVIALVCLIQHCPRANDGFTFGYKDMDETMGPCETTCPKTILDMLTPTDNKEAKAWRERCLQHIVLRKKAGKVKKSDWIEFKDALKFTSGQEEKRFAYVSGSTFKNGYSLFRISRWREREFKRIGREYFCQFKGTMTSKTRGIVPVELSCRFVFDCPTDTDARAEVFRLYEGLDTITEIKYTEVQ